MIILIPTYLLLIFLIIKFSNKFFVNKYELPQNIHSGIIPRIGGLPIFICYTLAIITLIENKFYEGNIILITSSIIFFIGFVEDLIQKVKHFIRLIVILLTSFSYFFLIQDTLPKIDIFFIDMLFEKYPYLKILFFSIGLSGFINGSNMTDGANGLFAISNIFIGISILILSSTLKLNLVNKEIIFLIIFLILFLLFNYPLGKIFIGDGGAYYISFILGIFLIIIFSNYENINSWLAITIIIYPMLELFFSIIRKLSIGLSPLKADKKHLHLIIFSYLNKSFDKKVANNLVVLYMLPIISLPLSNILFLNYFQINLFILILIDLCIYVFYYYFFYKLNFSN